MLLLTLVLPLPHAALLCCLRCRVGVTDRQAGRARAYIHTCDQAEEHTTALTHTATTATQ